MSFRITHMYPCKDSFYHSLIKTQRERSPTVQKQEQNLLSTIVCFVKMKIKVVHRK